MGTHRLLVVGRDRLLRDCLRTALDGSPELAVAADSSTGVELGAAVEEVRPDVVLLDLTGDDGWASRAVAELARRDEPGDAEAAGGRRPPPPVLLLGNGAEEQAVACIEAGARGYLPREASLDDLAGAIRRILAGEVVCPPGLAYSTFSRLAQLSRRLRKNARLEALKLTPRELEVLALVAEGLSNRLIAERLSLSVYTIKNHVHNILEKLEVETRSQAVRHAFEHGWLRERRSERRETGPGRAAPRRAAPRRAAPRGAAPRRVAPRGASPRLGGARPPPRHAGGRQEPDDASSADTKEHTP